MREVKMSSHWYRIHSKTLKSVTNQDVANILKKLAQSNPQLAKRLAGIDWAGVRQKIAKSALQKAASELGASCGDTFHNEGRDIGGQPIGVISFQDIQVGVTIEKDGSLKLFHNGRSADRSGGDIKKCEEAFSRHYRIQANLVVAQLLGQNVQVQTAQNGVVVISADVEKVKA
jgi:hypothetical protein